MIRGMGLGMPFWSFGDWRGGLYARDSRSTDFLAQYVRVFNAVEGNTTFYATPSATTVARWREDSPPGFRFCFKLPRTITHDAALSGMAGEEAVAFLERLAPLRDRLGPVLIQLPAGFGPERLERLEPFLGGLPEGFRYAVELRDPAFFEPGSLLARLADEILEAAGAGRVVMDTRALRDGPGDHPDVLAARHKKPDLPVREVALGPEPVLRLVLHPLAAVNERWLERWARILGDWVARGLDPIVFVHSPSNRESPAFARSLHARIAAHVEVGRLPAWPGERGESASGQLALL